MKNFRAQTLPLAAVLAAAVPACRAADGSANAASLEQAYGASRTESSEIAARRQERIRLGEELAQAAFLGDAAKIQELLKAGADVNYADDGGYTALMMASLHQDPDGGPLVKLLLAAGADANARTSHGNTPLMNASGAANAEAIEALLAAGADVNARDSDGQTPLIRACLHIHSDEGLEAMRTLLAADPKPDVDAKDKNGETALMNAAQWNQTGTITLLLNAGARVNAVDNGRWTALMYAEQSGASDAVRLLKANGGARTFWASWFH